MFPGANAQIYRNEVGEVIGWDYPSYDDAPEYDYDDYLGQDEWCPGPVECKESGMHGKDWNGKNGTWNDETLDWENCDYECAYCQEPLEDEEIEAWYTAHPGAR